jgi:hypothetical protein
MSPTDAAEPKLAGGSLRSATWNLGWLIVVVTCLGLGYVNCGLAGLNSPLRMEAFLFHCGSLLFMPKGAERMQAVQMGYSSSPHKSIKFFRSGGTKLG